MFIKGESFADWQFMAIIVDELLFLTFITDKLSYL